MPFSLTDILLGGIAPVVVTGGVLVLMRRLLPRELAERYSATIAFLSGFMTGYGSLALGPWTPTAHWHWLPYAMLGAAFVGPLACASGIGAVGRAFLYVVFAMVAAWTLVPAWEDLAPPRSVHLAAFAVYVAGMASLLELLATRLLGPLLPAILWCTMTTAAVILAISGSLRFAQIAIAGAAALFGITLVACMKRDANLLSGIAPVFSVLAAGSLMIGRVNSFSEVPLVAYMLVPIAPLMLGCGTTGPLGNLTGVKRPIVLAILPISLLVASVLLAAIADMNGSAGENL